VANVIKELATDKESLLSDRGDIALRGLGDPVRLYDLRWQQEA
jgi:class 3 adenylate cyclase